MSRQGGNPCFFYLSRIRERIGEKKWWGTTPRSSGEKIKEVVRNHATEQWRKEKSVKRKGKNGLRTAHKRIEKISGNHQQGIR